MSLGALIEQDFDCPNVTIECGGRTDKQAHELAYRGITRFCSYQELNEYHYNTPIEIIHTPLRLQIKKAPCFYSLMKTPIVTALFSELICKN